eukprot:353124-Chlamydomonas_euryale.AAC.1
MVNGALCSDCDLAAERMEAITSKKGCATAPSTRWCGLEGAKTGRWTLKRELVCVHPLMVHQQPWRLQVVDLKESENHLLDRHCQLHDEVEAVKANVRTLNDALTAVQAE